MIRAAVTLALVLLATPVDAASTSLPASKSVILQGFHWESVQTYPWWNVVSSKADDIAGSGFDMVWLPPSGRSADGAPEGYLPNELYTQSGAYGTQTQLQATIGALHQRGIKVLADVVINHRVGTYNWADFTNPTWGSDAVCRGDEWAGATGNPDTGLGYSAARDVDHTQTYVQNSIVGWLGWMKSTIGYDGWRFDFTKGFSGSYVGMYDSATSPWYSVGEYWEDLNLSNPDAHRQGTVNWIDATGGRSAAFDFTTKGLLQQAVAYNEYWRLKDGSGKPAGVIGWWPSNAVTFLDNHDTGPSTGSNAGQNLWPFPSDKVMLGYAYLLTHPGVPSVYWVHYYDWNLHDAIKALLQLRAQQGLTSTSKVAIQVADSSRYAAIIDDRVAVKIGPGDWSPGTGWAVALSGSGYAVWTKAAGGSTGRVRTVVYMYMQTQPGQNIFIRGGHDTGLVSRGYYASADEPISYLNTLNATTSAVKAGDTKLDWYTDSALDWTTNTWPASWGTARYYAVDGYGIDPENTKGAHWWKFDVTMTGKAGDWFEFKAFLSQNGSVTWEPDIHQSGTPYTTNNHWAKKGFTTFVTFGQSTVQFTPLQ